MAATATTQYLDFDDGYSIAAKFVKNVPAMEIVVDDGDVFAQAAPCGCYSEIACSHPSMVELCSTHHADAFS